MMELPRDGVLTIGRSPDAQIVLDDSSVSREHARLEMRSGQGTISDLGSQNGTTVNGRPAEGGVLLAPGDVIELGLCSMVFHTTARLNARRGPVEPLELRRQLEREIERARVYQRSVAILVVRFAENHAGEVERSLVAGDRLLDLVSMSRPGEALVLAPETDRDAALMLARGLEGALAGVAGLSIGFAVGPADGLDPDALLASARDGAGGSGGVSAGRDAFRRLAIGERTILVAAPAIAQLYRLVERLAASDVPVLVCGETGVGKEAVAGALHQWSPRKSAPLVAVNCAALPEQLVEGELFGYQRGAFSGAHAAKAGLIETADRGTLFLDEIGELPLAVQAKLLRVLESKRVARLGAVKETSADVRVVAATNRVLEREVAAGRFRQDLYFRLTGGVLTIPPLRDRPREIPILAQAFLAAACADLGRPPMHISDQAMAELSSYGWPGNVRELKLAVEFIAAAHPEAVITAEHVRERLERTRAGAAPGSGPIRPVREEIEELERERMAAAMAAAGGVQMRAAELIGMPLRTFVAKLKKYGMR